MKIDAINPNIVVVEGGDVEKRAKICQSIAKDIADGREIINVIVVKDMVAMAEDISWGDKVIIVPDADSLIPARRSASNVNLLFGYWIYQSGKKNVKWVFGCKDFNKIEIRVRKYYDLVVKAKG